MASSYTAYAHAHECNKSARIVALQVRVPNIDQQISQGNGRSRLSCKRACDVDLAHDKSTSNRARGVGWYEQLWCHTDASVATDAITAQEHVKEEAGRERDHRGACRRRIVPVGVHCRLKACAGARSGFVPGVVLRQVPNAVTLPLLGVAEVWRPHLPHLPKVGGVM